MWKIFFYSLRMFFKNNFLLLFNQDIIFAKALSIIYADLESLIWKVDVCEYNPDKLSTTKVSEFIPCVYSISMILTFDGEYCMKRFCES